MMVNNLQSFIAKQRFIVVGGHKCGTTSLHHYLAQHPEILMPQIKGKDILNKAEVKIGDYQNLYDNTIEDKVFGEVSSVYLYSEKACQTIKNFFPDAKLIIILRNPSERAFSHLQARDTKDKQIVTSLEKLKSNPEDNVLDNGLYSTQIQMYYENFSKDQIKILLFDDFIKNQKAFFYSLFDFVDVEPNFLPDTSVVFRKGGKINDGLKAKIMSNKKIKSSIKLLIEPFTTAEQRRLIGKKLENFLKIKKADSHQLKKQLSKFYYDDILKTQELTSMDLSHWL